MDSIFDYEHPFVCTDAVIFSIRTEESDNYRKLPETELQILLYKRTTDPYNGKWCLPGGFLNIDEMPEDNIMRKISEKSDVSGCRLEQLYTFCNIDRDPRARVLSIAYVGLMNEKETAKRNDNSVRFTIKFDGEGNMVFEKDDLVLGCDDIGFDHVSIIRTALERIRSKILYTDIAFSLLPEEFTLTYLQNVYGAILGKKDQAANFRRKIMDMVEETGTYVSDKGHRPAKLYKKRRM